MECLKRRTRGLVAGIGTERLGDAVAVEFPLHLGNAELIHENVELLHPTGSNWTKSEIAKGPVLLQADHGPVAFRNVRVRPYVATGSNQEARDGKDGERLLAALLELQQLSSDGYGANHPKYRAVKVQIDKLRLAGAKVDLEKADELYLATVLENKRLELDGHGADHPKRVAAQGRLKVLQKEAAVLNSKLAQQELEKLVRRAAELLDSGRGPMHPEVRANYALIAYLAEMLAKPAK